MPDQLQLRGGTTTEHNSFTGVAREVTVDTTKKTLVVHDGSQAGGTPLMKESGANAASSVSIGTGGTNALNIDSNQKIGIGQASPATTLDVNGDVTITDKIIHSGDTDTKIRFPVANQISFETQGSEAVRIDENGKVGIGTDNPNELLTVKGNAPIIRIEENQSGGSKRLDLGVTNSGSVGFIGANQSASSLAFQTTNNERMRITSTGDVGIGTTSPTYPTELTVSDTTAYSASATNSTQHQLRINNAGLGGVAGILLTAEPSSGSAGHAGIRVISPSSGNADMTFSVRDGGTYSEKLRILSSGNVGIGTTSPTSTLHLDASSGAVLQLQRTSSNASNKISLSHDGTNGTLDSTNATLFRNGGGEKMRIDSSGRMLLGTTTEGHPDADDFTIERASGYVGITLRSATDQGGAIYFSDATSGTGEYDGQIIYSQASRKMQFGAGNGIRLELEDGFSKFAGGRILLGTSTEGHPDADDLTLESASGYTGITLRAANTAGGAIYFSDATTGTGEYSGQILYSHASNVMTFGVSSSERMRIGSTGDVLIGTTSAVTDTTFVVDGNMALRNSSTGNNQVVKTFVVSRAYSMSTTSLAVLKLDNWGTSAFEITAFRRDTASPHGAEVTKLYVGVQGSGSNMTDTALVQETKVTKGSIHTATYSINDNGNFATIDITGDDNGGEAQTLIFYIIANGGSDGEVTVL